MAQAEQHLADRITDELEFTEGSSAVGELSRFHRENPTIDTPTPANATIEFYDGTLDGIQVLGAIATRWNYDPNGNEYYVDFATEAGYNIVVNLGFSEKFLDPKGQLSPVARQLGLNLEVRELEGQKRELAFTAPRDVEDIDNKYRVLEINDRTLVPFDPERFSGVEMITKLSHKEFLVSDGTSIGLHDRAVHIMSYILLSPRLVDIMASNSQEMIEYYQSALDLVDGRSCDELDFVTREKFDDALVIINGYSSKIDFHTPLLANFLCGEKDDESTRKSIRGHLMIIARSTDEELLDELVDDALAWRDTLVERAQALEAA